MLIKKHWGSAQVQMVQRWKENGLNSSLHLSFAPDLHQCEIRFRPKNWKYNKSKPPRWWNCWYSWNGYRIICSVRKRGTFKLHFQIHWCQKPLSIHYCESKRIVHESRTARYIHIWWLRLVSSLRISNFYGLLVWTGVNFIAHERKIMFPVNAGPDCDPSCMPTQGSKEP